MRMAFTHRVALAGVVAFSMTALAGCGAKVPFSQPAKTTSTAVMTATPIPTPSVKVDPLPAPETDRLSDPASYSVVVNKKRPLNPVNFVPSDLVQPNIPNNNGQPVRATVGTFL